ncbi:hypothetical protein OHS18_22835 [Amycolatopsis sp. NBC_00355]|uniref:hypothetical protein n=1 Tax=Amycolatopsis sp. NBC_00355 TaxID=2975957 RepID=UPI002E254452
MNRNSVHRSFVIVDIEKFGRRADTDQRWLRRQMYEILRNAMSDTGIDWETCHRQDAGDSVILLVPAETSKMLVTDTFVGRLDRELAGYARRSNESVRLRMRLALHAGEVTQDEHGWVGSDLNTACRLVDLQQARDALSDTPDANLVLVVSHLWYSSVVLQDPVLVEHFGFEQIPFVAKEIDSHAWLHIKGKEHPAAERPTAPPAASMPASGASAPTGGIHFHGPVHKVGDPVQGDKTQVTFVRSDD